LSNPNNNAWKISANDDDDDGYIDEDALLEEDDLKKPDPSSLKAGTIVVMYGISFQSIQITDSVSGSSIQNRSLPISGCIDKRIQKNFILFYFELTL